MKEGKNFKVLGVRQSLIGDCIMSLPVLQFVEKRRPNSYKYWHVAKKCSQSAPLFYNHPLIDKIVITDCEEGFGPKDIELAKQCDFVFNTTPQHPFGECWHDHRNMLQETWVMAGIDLKEFEALTEEEKTPSLTKWFNTNRESNTIAVHCFAGYGRDNHRSPSKEWWAELIELLTKQGFKVIRLGHPKEPELTKCNDLRHLSFLEQIQIALGCDMYIGTDSGFSLVMGAYSHPQITLLTNWNVNHFQNPTCLQPINKNNISLFNEFIKGGCSGISKDKVLENIKNLL
jgi:ADP-heptose:LPS heptosyltransferase